MRPPHLIIVMLMKSCWESSDIQAWLITEDMALICLCCSRLQRTAAGGKRQGGALQAGEQGASAEAQGSEEAPPPQRPNSFPDPGFAPGQVTGLKPAELEARHKTHKTCCICSSSAQDNHTS